MKITNEVLSSVANRLAYTTQDFDFDHILPIIRAEHLCPDGIDESRFAAMIMQYVLTQWGEA